MRGLLALLLRPSLRRMPARAHRNAPSIRVPQWAQRAQRAQWAQWAQRSWKHATAEAIGVLRGTQWAGWANVLPAGDLHASAMCPLVNTSMTRSVRAAHGEGGTWRYMAARTRPAAHPTQSRLKSLEAPLRRAGLAAAQSGRRQHRASASRRHVTHLRQDRGQGLSPRASALERQVELTVGRAS